MYTITTSNVTVMITDMDRSINFYTGLGLTLKNRWDNNYAVVEAPGVAIGLHPSEKPVHNDSFSIGFGVEDLHPVKQRLSELKIEYAVQDDKSGTFIFFKDPDGINLYFLKSNVGDW